MPGIGVAEQQFSFLFQLTSSYANTMQWGLTNGGCLLYTDMQALLQSWCGQSSCPVPLAAGGRAFWSELRHKVIVICLVGHRLCKFYLWSDLL